MLLRLVPGPMVAGRLGYSSLKEWLCLEGEGSQARESTAHEPDWGEGMNLECPRMKTELVLSQRGSWEEG